MKFELFANIYIKKQEFYNINQYATMFLLLKLSNFIIYTG